MSSAAIRKANMFRGTALDPEANAEPDALITEALTVVKTNIEAHARTEGRTLSGAQLDRALVVAQRLLRTMPAHELRSINSSALLKSITEQSLAVAPASDPRTAPVNVHSAAADTPSARGAGKYLDLGERATTSSARYTEIGGGAVSAEVAHIMQQARHEAMRLGIPWAANQPDLLKLGTAAIKAIAATNLKETGYKALREGAQYDAKDVVAFARHSKLRNFDAERAAQSTAALVQSVPPEQRPHVSQVLRDFDRAAADHYAKPSDEGAKKRFEAAAQARQDTLREIAKQSPEAAAKVKRFEDDTNTEERFRATVKAEQKAEVRQEIQRTQEARAQIKESGADDLYAQLAQPERNDAPVTPTSGAPVKAAEATPPPSQEKPIQTAAGQDDKTKKPTTPAPPPSPKMA